MRDSQNVSSDQALEQVVEAFEVKWESNAPAAVTDYVRQLDTRGLLTQELLVELCLVDMEYRWRLNCADAGSDTLGSQPRLRDYERIFQLSYGLKFAPSQFAEEYRTRRLWGDAPTLDQFLAEFSAPIPRLLPLLRDVDRELASDELGVDPLSVSASIPPVNSDPRAPLPFSDFTLHELIGAGGMGKVYRATQCSLERDVAVKALAKSLQTDPIAVDRFVEEARLLARVHHPNIVGVHGLGRFPGGGYFLVMDYVAGRNLDEHRKTTRLETTDVISIATTLANAIQYSHSQGVIHCDLKPANVLVATDGRLLISDFGFAELIHAVHADSPPAPSRRGGTQTYTAPEWLDDVSATPSPTIDVYGLGAIIANLLSPCTTVWQELAEIRDKALSPDPSERFQTASELASALTRLSPTRSA